MDMQVYTIAGERVRQLRRNSGMTQEELAQKIGCESSYISLLERGQRKFNLEALVVIADIFDTSMDYLTGRSDKPDDQNWERGYKHLREKLNAIKFIVEGENRE